MNKTNKHHNKESMGRKINTDHLRDLLNIDNSECFGVEFVKIYPEMTSQ
jgi:hypothetical protein